MEEVFQFGVPYEENVRSFVKDLMDVVVDLDNRDVVDLECSLVVGNWLNQLTITVKHDVKRWKIHEREGDTEQSIVYSLHNTDKYVVKKITAFLERHHNGAVCDTCGQRGNYCLRCDRCDRARRQLAAVRIQQAWRRCTADPKFSVCRRRLLREFEELGQGPTAARPQIF